MADDLTVSASVVISGDTMAAVSAFLGISQLAGAADPSTGQPTYTLDTDTIGAQVQGVMAQSAIDLVSDALARAISQKQLGLLPDSMAANEQAKADAAAASVVANQMQVAAMKQASVDATSASAALIAVAPLPIARRV